MNRLLVQKATSLTTTLLASASSAVKWSTPRKVKDLGDQLHIFSQLEQSIATQRQLFRKVKKGFQEQSFALATA
ncbi:transposase [Colletotrichum kahawae]|uniref:Transposase n=1 Tax=Colletotrichum kahawae TaxID=34407 RepID=A0AAD9XZJ6_COLKA|nr:transposase [Colletotrichum kahawae]